MQKNSDIKGMKNHQTITQILKKNSCFQLQIQFSPRIIFRTLWSTWSAPKRDTPSSRSEPTAAKQQPGGVIRRRCIATLCVRLEIKKLQSFLVVVLLGLGLFGFEHTHIKHQTKCGATANVQVLKSTTGCEEDFFYLPTLILHSCCFILYLCMYLYYLLCHIKIF